MESERERERERAVEGDAGGMETGDCGVICCLRRGGITSCLFTIWSVGDYLECRSIDELEEEWRSWEIISLVLLSV